MSWSCDSLVFGYPGATAPAVDGVSLDLGAAPCTAVLGPNGSGKSTLLRLLLGVLDPESGSVRFGDRVIGSWPRRALARRIGVVPQQEEFSLPITVRELVAMGRYPHLGALRGGGAADRRAVDAALERCDVTHLAGREVATLSGGERQRARLARALAQEPRILALDEPTAALDVRHEMAIFELLRDLAGGGVTVVLVTHNLNLASRYADRLVLLDRGAVAAEGSAATVLRRDLLERVYAWPLRVFAHSGPGHDAGAPQVVPIARNPNVNQESPQ